jgi:hypothetical protein
MESRVGRTPMSRLHLIDLRNGERERLEWPSDDIGPAVTAVRGGVVFGRPGSADGPSWCWRSGGPIERLPYRILAIDPITGTLAAIGDGGLMVVRPDGRHDRLSLRLGGPVAVVPGGKALLVYEHPPAVRLVPVDGGDPVVIRLPEQTRATPSLPQAVVWETPTKLLFVVDNDGVRGAAPAIRVDVATGAIEGVPLPPGHAHRPVLVQPLL